MNPSRGDVHVLAIVVTGRRRVSFHPANVRGNPGVGRVGKGQLVANADRLIVQSCSGDASA